ncbi:hypothetical protein [Bacillus sp. 03113]|uniref:hypothetical protein n=1 Tax=Bacillus sp. 03113 TaxID=2578211 RepID=UPI00215C9FE0|nr:hypothetical protein [Bacillus sp. 03113]
MWLVPALLGPFQTPTNHPCHHRLVAKHADSGLPSRCSARDGKCRYRNRAAERTHSRWGRSDSVAHDHDTVSVQAAGYDPVRVA